MKTKLLSLLLFIFLGTTFSFAQVSFDQKKHDTNTTKITSTQEAQLNLQKLKPKSARPVVSNGLSNFKTPLSLSSTLAKSKYILKSVQTTTDGNSFFIKSSTADDTKKILNTLDEKEVAKDYLDEIMPLLHVNNDQNDFRILQSSTDELGQNHIKMQQVYKGIPVYGSEVIVHIDKKKGTIGINGSQINNLELTSISPKIDLESALSLIESNLGHKLPDSNVNHLGLVKIPAPEGALLFYNNQEETFLTYHITVYANLMDRWEYFIDANSGVILDKYYHTCSFLYNPKQDNHKNETTAAPPSVGTGQDLNGVTRQLGTFNLNGVNYLLNASKTMYNAAQSQLPDKPIGAILTLDLNNKPYSDNAQIFHVQNSTNNWNNPAGVSAHYNADIAYEYFKNKFSRNSINGQGGTIFSFINVADPDTGGGMDNAFWNGFGMFYGNGNVALKSIAGSLDVGGHEMSHGVIQNTANLEYRNQSGALNESFADVFGVLIDRDDWTLGEDIVKTQYYPSGALRNMMNPNNGGTPGNYSNWQPKNMSEFVTTQQDNGGVHINSGIPNRAFYLFANVIGKDKAEQVYYRTLTTYLTASSQFIDLRLGVIQAATDLYGANSAEVQAAISAFDTVGIVNGAPTDIDNDIPVATGSDFILSVDVDPNNANSLYISDTNGNNFVPLTTTKIYRKPSVADDGSLAIYVTEDYTINAISLDVNNIEEFVVSDQPIWASVALSKDGTKLAAVRNDVNGSIYISDLETSTAKTFELYNPTTANGINTGEVLYADAIEWDYSGQYLIYDALNEISNTNGLTINYWDVGSLKVWNNQTNTFGEGSIQKIFTNLPEGVSIGNPSFAKTSGNILAFDYFDEISDLYEVITANIETGQVKSVYQNNKLGFPNYSKTDTKLLFDTNNGTSEDIAIINLGADKLSPQGSPSILIPDGIWGIWYTVGNRTTTSSAKDITDFRFSSTNPASIGVITGNTINITISSTANRQSLVASFTNSQKSQVYIGNQLQQSGVNTNNFTNPLSYKVVAEDGTSKTYTVIVTVAAPNNPNDTDSDGVPNDVDQCPNTPIGTIVDTSGCPKFSLPATNFRISTSGETCIESNNGSLSITAEQNLNYTVTLTGNGINQMKTFNSATNYNNLPGGTYSLCFTIQGQNGYKLCYDIVIAKAESLSVSGKVDSSQSFITLQLKGAATYYVTLNNELLITKESNIKLDITSSRNKISVKTDKDCQGVYEEEFIINEGIQIFPNPISDGNLHITVPNSEATLATLQIATIAGQTVVSKQVAINNGEINFDVSTLNEAVYIIYLLDGKNIRTQKIIIKK